MYRKNQEKINQMEPAQAEQYKALVQESLVLQDQCAQHQAQIDQVIECLFIAWGRLKLGGTVSRLG